MTEHRENTYTDSCKKRLTLCIVMSAVGEEDIMIIGKLFPRVKDMDSTQ